MDNKIHEMQTQPATAMCNVPDIPSVFILSRRAIKLFNISFFFFYRKIKYKNIFTNFKEGSGKYLF
jgi:hypothetical protein